jgi:hypothetical protein
MLVVDVAGIDGMFGTLGVLSPKGAGVGTEGIGGTLGSVGAGWLVVGMPAGRLDAGKVGNVDSRVAGGALGRALGNASALPGRGGKVTFWDTVGGVGARPAGAGGSPGRSGWPHTRWATKAAVKHRHPPIKISSFWLVIFPPPFHPDLVSPEVWSGWRTNTTK